MENVVSMERKQRLTEVFPAFVDNVIDEEGEEEKGIETWPASTANVISTNYRLLSHQISRKRRRGSKNGVEENEPLEERIMNICR